MDDANDTDGPDNPSSGELDDSSLTDKTLDGSLRGSVSSGDSLHPDSSLAQRSGTEAPKQSQPDPLIGQTIAKKYKIVAKLGRGAMGGVYKAEHAYMSRTVALKLLHAHLVHDEDSLRRFQNEARTASRMTHSNAVTLYDFGIDNERPYLAMKFVQGRTLKTVLKEEGAQSAARISEFLLQVGGALEEAHSLGIVHRDLKPDNIMVSRKADGQEWFEVLDFGIAKVLRVDGDNSSSVLTQTGIVIGTPQYMSPEQALVKELDARADIYSLGIILYEMLTGHVPFRSESLMEMLMAHINDKPPPLRKFKPELRIPKEIEKVVLKALEKDPKARHQSVRELMEEFFAAMPREVQRGKLPSRFGLIAGGAIIILGIPLVSYVLTRHHERKIPTQKTAQAAETGSINVTSSPAGAAVLLNGEQKGITPLLIEGVQFGTYIVQVRRDGFENRSYTLKVTSGLTYAMTFPLKAVLAAKSETITLANAAIEPTPKFIETPKAISTATSKALTARDRLLERFGAVQTLSPTAQVPPLTAMPQITALLKATPFAETSVPTVVSTPVAATFAATAVATVPATVRATVVSSARPVTSVPTEAPTPVLQATVAATQLAKVSPLPTKAMQPTVRAIETAADSVVEQETKAKIHALALSRTPVPVITSMPEDPDVVVVEQPKSSFKAQQNINIAKLKPPEVVPQLKSTSTENPFMEGKRLLADGKYEQAAIRLEAVVEKDNRNADALNLLGTCYLRMGKHPNFALRKFQDAFRVNSQNPETHLNLAIVYAKLGNPSKMFEELDKVIALDGRYRAKLRLEPAFKIHQNNPRFKAYL